MIRIVNSPDRSLWRGLMQRAVSDDGAIEERVEAIVEAVRMEGDAALRRLAQEIDGVEIGDIEVSRQAIEAAQREVSDDLKRAIGIAAENIRTFHTAQLSKGVDIETMPGVRCIQREVAIGRVGLYIPGGTAPLSSTVLMLAIPAQVAGCGEVVVCTPPNSKGEVAAEILYAAAVCGVDRVFVVGGAQAIAAMAYGTETIPRVDKIFGPGNRYVTKAKQLVSMSQVAIDMPAGPSEVMVLADGSSCADFVAADLLSQAEHGADSQAIAVVDSAELAQEIAVCVERQLEGLSRADVARKSMGNSYIAVLEDRAQIIDFANQYAAEHLIISMEDAWAVADRITAAGSIFIGNYSPESAGDYASGTNHTLPTAGWARAYSGVNTSSFMKKITIQELSPEGLTMVGNSVMTMASAEGLDAHRNAVEIRLNSLTTNNSKK